MLLKLPWWKDWRYRMKHLSEVVAFLKGESRPEPYGSRLDLFDEAQVVPEVDFAEIKGQERAKRAIEVALPEVIIW